MLKQPSTKLNLFIIYIYILIGNNPWLITSKVQLVYLGDFFIKTATCNECHGGFKGDFCKFFLFFISSPRIDSSGF